MCMVWTQMIPISTVPTVPTANPAFLNASGIANIPVPIFPFSKCIIVSQFLMNNNNAMKIINRIYLSLI